VPHLKSGKLLALAISGARRATAAPEVPTLAEVFPGTQLVTWIGLVAPMGTSPQVVDKLSQAAAKVLAAPETLRQLAALATDPEPMSAQEMGRRMQRDQVQWLELMREAGIQPE
jgi:tripartite-type tricarboxylate transporter receptor subunit TctC